MDWVSRNLFWTSYDANKKQINVARLDGSFKNAVIQGLERPHCLVLHPLLGWVSLSHTHTRTHACRRTHTHTCMQTQSQMQTHTHMQMQM